MTCIFCEMASGAMPCEKIAENDHAFAIKDIAPQAPVHILVIPKKHIPNIMCLEDPEIMWNITQLIKDIAKQLEISERGLRLVNNLGEDGGQTVDHLHIHCLAGRSLTWPPG